MEKIRVDFCAQLIGIVIIDMFTQFSK